MKIAIIAGGQTAEANGTLGSGEQLVSAGQALGHTVEILQIPDAGPAVERIRALLTLTDFDVTIPLLAGLEGTLELLRVPYVGSAPDAAGVAANKAAFNVIVAGAGLQKVPFAVLDTSRGDGAAVLDLGLPLYVKPARLGASYGISRVTDYSRLQGAIDAAAEHDHLVVVEREVPRPFYEVEVATIWTDQPVTAAARIRTPGAAWRDTAWKYSLETRVEPIADAAVAQACVDVAHRLCSLVNLSGAMRFDLFVSGGGAVYVGEVNALPGHGEASTFPRILEMAGVPRPRQLELMIQAALRHDEISFRQRVRA